MTLVILGGSAGCGSAADEDAVVVVDAEEGRRDGVYGGVRSSFDV